MPTTRPITAFFFSFLSLAGTALHGAQPTHGSPAPKIAAPSITMPRTKGFAVPQTAARPSAPRTQPSLPPVTRTTPKVMPSQPARAAGAKAFEPKGWGHTTPPLTPQRAPQSSAGIGPTRPIPSVTTTPHTVPPVTLKPRTVPHGMPVTLPSRPATKPAWPSTTDAVHPGTPGRPTPRPSNPSTAQPPILIALPIPVPLPIPGPAPATTPTRPDSSQPTRPRDEPTVLIDTNPAQPASPTVVIADSPTLPKTLPTFLARPLPGTPRSRANALMAAQMPAWQSHTECMPFGGTPDVNGNGIPDIVYDTMNGRIVLNPAESDSDNNGLPDVLDVDADGNNIPDGFEWEHSVLQGLLAAGIDPFADDDQDGENNAQEYFLADADGDGIVNLNDATPCGDAPADPPGVAGGGVPSGGFFPIPLPMPVPMPLGVPGGGPAGFGPVAEQPVERSVLVATAGDVDADSDNSSPTQEPDHSVAEEQAEDDGVGLVVRASTAEDRRRAPIDVKLPTVGPQTLVRFRDAGGHLALFTSDPLENPEARRLEFDRDYSATDLTFTSDVFRRLYIESTAAGQDALSVEIDLTGDGTWIAVDGLVVTSQPSASAIRGGLSARPAAVAARAQVQVNQSFLLPAQGIGSNAGKVAITFGTATFDCPVEKWTDSALQARVAAVPLSAAADGELVITLADGRVAATIPVRVAPAAGPATITQAALRQ